MTDTARVSQENVELAKRLQPGVLDYAMTFADPNGLEAFKSAMTSLFDPEFETIPDPKYWMLIGNGEPAEGSSEELVVKGIAGFANTFGDWLSEWERWEVTPTGFSEVSSDQVLVSVDISASSKIQGVEMTTQAANLFTFREGRVARLEMFLQRRDALEAAGLRG
jgi:hypothetical protein